MENTKTNKQSITLGFDIGVASVGWAILKEDGHIVDCGVRLFDDPSGQDGKLVNEDRRNFRHIRRNNRRERYRKNRLINLFIKEGFIKNKEDFFNLIKNIKKPVIELRNEGISKEISKNELMSVLYWYIKHRGYFDTSLNDEENEQNKIDITKLDKLPIECQISDFKKYGYYVGTNNRSFNHDGIKKRN